MELSAIRARLRALLPARWFADESPVLDAVLEGVGAPAADLAERIEYADKQTRIRTASDGWLDLIAADFFGARIRRRRRQGDASFRRRILSELLRERGTRAGLAAILLDLTGREPDIFEPARATDTGGYGHAASMGYGAAGRYGSILHPAQAFVTAFRPLDIGVPYASGYGFPAAGYRAGGTQWAGATAADDAVTDSDINQAIAAAIPAGTVAWTRITA